MAVKFLTSAERERLTRFPEEIDTRDMIVYFTLSSSDMEQVGVWGAMEQKVTLRPAGPSLWLPICIGAVPYPSNLDDATRVVDLV